MKQMKEMKEHLMYSVSNYARDKTVAQIKLQIWNDIKIQTFNQIRARISNDIKEQLKEEII